VSATLRLTRADGFADAARPYQIVVDAEAAAEIRNAASTELPIGAGTHTLQVRTLKIVGARPGLASPTVTFEVGDGEVAGFTCHPPSYPRAAFRWFAALLGERDRWIELESAQ
jgi:hypothetical protein